MLERVSYRPRREPTHEAAKAYLPEFLYRDPDNGTDIEISDDFYGARRKLRLGILGAGLTCINFLHFLKETIPLESVDIVVYEKESDWHTSRYPGCRSDHPGALYQFSWRSNVWSEFYPPAAENVAYLQSVARENDFYQFIRFKHEITKASWADDEAKWTLTVHDLGKDTSFDDKVDVFLEFNGPVSNPQITLLGLEAFEGDVMHPARWDDSVDLNGKRVALVGYGSSGIQIAPSIIHKVSKMYTWFRNKTWIMGPPPYAMAGISGANFRYTGEQKALLSDPHINLAYQKAVEDFSYRRLTFLINGSSASKRTREGVQKYMETRLASKPEVLKQILPEDFEPGCRRPALAHGYLEAITDPKTTVLSSPPQRVTKKGLLDADGTEYEVDAIIVATGYDQSHLPRYPKTVNGQDMRKKWEPLDCPPSYMAVALGGMPNYFNISSAFAPLHGTYFQASEAMVKYVVKVLNKMQVEHIRSLVPKDRAVDHFIRHANAFNERMVQSGPCAAWYKSKSGRPALWPGGRSHFMEILDNPRFEDFDIQYEDEADMFSYMGNGFTLDVDGDENADKTWYLGQPNRPVDDSILQKLAGVHGEAPPTEGATEPSERPRL